MPFSKAAALELPGEFDVAAYDRILPRVMAFASPNDDDAVKRNAAQMFAQAWNGVAMRLRATFAYDEDFRATVELRYAKTPAERWMEERALFGCIVSALSAIECFFTASYAIGAAKSPSLFPITKPIDRRKAPEEVRDAFAVAYPSAPFFGAMDGVIKSSGYRQLKTIRNVLAHRGILPRRHYQPHGTHRHPTVPANPGALAAELGYADQLDDAMTRKHYEFAVATLNTLAAELDTFLTETLDGAAPG